MDELGQYRNLFFQGKYQSLVDAQVSGRISLSNQDVVPFLIASYGFLGRVEEANEYFRIREAHLISYNRIAARFFLAMTYTRLSKYEKAKRLFAQNFFEWRKEGQSVRTSFYIFQSVAFFRYFSGLFGRAKKFANRSLGIAMQGLETWKKIYALDILGHTCVQLGEYHQGMEHLRFASEMAQLSQYKGTSKAIEHSRVGYSLEYGDRLKENIAKANFIIEQKRTKEFYLDSQLLLQLSKAYFIQGKIGKMQEALDTAAYGIYRNSNRRQSVLLNLGYSLISSLSKNHSKAFFHVSSAKDQIDETVDYYYSAKIKGMEHRLLKEHSRNESTIIWNELVQLSRKTENALALRYTDGLRKDGSDPISLLLQGSELNSFPSESFIQELIDARLLGMLNLFPKVQDAQEVIWFGIKPRSMVIYHKGACEFIQWKLTKNLYQFVKFVAKFRSVSKQQIIEELWGYKYRPHLHDSLVYNAIYRLKKVEPLLADWISIGARIELGKDVKVIGLESNLPKIESLETKSDPTLSDEVFHQFNYRQIQLLQSLNFGDSIRPQDFSRHFEVSKMTATRDLRSLAEGGYLRAVGNTRSLVYQRQ